MDESITPQDMKNIQEIISNRLLYIGNEIPESIAKDTHSKFVLLGYPHELIDELNEWKSRFSTPEEILEEGRRNYDPRKLKIAVESARKVAIAIEKRENGR